MSVEEEQKRMKDLNKNKSWFHCLTFGFRIQEYIVNISWFHQTIYYNVSLKKWYSEMLFFLWGHCFAYNLVYFVQMVT